MKTLSEKIAVMQAAERGEKIEKKNRFEAGAGYVWAGSADAISWDWVGYDYRVAREEPSIDWGAVAQKFKWLAVDKNGAATLFSELPSKEENSFKIGFSGSWVNPIGFASFRPGNIPWEEATPIKRPEGK